MREAVGDGPHAGFDPHFEAVGEVLVKAVRELGASMGSLYLLPPDEQLLHLVMTTGIPVQIIKPWIRVAVPAPIPVADAVREQRLVWVDGHETLARDYPRAAVALPYHFALAAAPVSHGPTRWGSLLLLWPRARPPRLAGHERDTVSDACRRLGELLRQAADEGRPVLPGNEPRTLDPPHTGPIDPREVLAASSFAERLPGGCYGLDPNGRITFVTTGAARLLGRPGPELLGAQPWEVLPWLNDPVFEDRYRAAVISRDPTSFTACRPPDHWLHFRLYPDESGLSVRINPTDIGSEPPPGATKTLTSPTRTGQLYHLMHLAAALTEAVGVQDVIAMVADQIMPAFGAKGLVLYLAENDRLLVTGYRGYTTEAMDYFENAPLRSSFSPAARALADGVPSFFASPEELERLYPGLPKLTGKSAWTFLPLITSGHSVGCCVLSYARPHAFPPDERAILGSLAGLIAQALDRARLYDTKQQLAHSLQMGLLPHALPRIPGLRVAARYLPAARDMDIGGDFYDLIRLNSTTAAAVIGDVQGHNISAAALMGQVRTAVHATAGAPPGEVLARTNRLLTDLDPGLFTSCLYVHLDLRTHRACLASAGHPPPILRHRDRRTEILTVPPGPLLGIDPTAHYPVTEIPLPAGALLALYTDGLIETSGTDIDEATADLAGRLARAPEQPLDDLAESLIDHARRTGQGSDDIAFLLLDCL